MELKILTTFWVVKDVKRDCVYKVLPQYPAYQKLSINSEDYYYYYIITLKTITLFPIYKFLVIALMGQIYVQFCGGFFVESMSGYI